MAKAEQSLTNEESCSRVSWKVDIGVTVHKEAILVAIVVSPGLDHDEPLYRVDSLQHKDRNCN